jgi:hypothetical protein
MQEIELQPFIQEVLQKNTYNSLRNNHANPSCNTFLQEKHHKMPKSLPSTSVPSLNQRKYPRYGTNFRPPYAVNKL